MSKFNLGQVVMTRGIAEAIEKDKEFKAFVNASFLRHTQCDWGELCEDDKEMNELALIHNDRLFSSYTLNDWKVWIITEWDRSVTTILFPSEY